MMESTVGITKVGNDMFVDIPIVMDHFGATPTLHIKFFPVMRYGHDVKQQSAISFLNSIIPGNVATHPIVATEPVAAQPVLTHAVSTQSAVTKPVVAQSAVAQSAVTTLAAVKPAIARPVVAQLVATHPTVAQSVIAQPAAVKPVIVQPIVTSSVSKSASTKKKAKYRNTDSKSHRSRSRDSSHRKSRSSRSRSRDYSRNSHRKGTNSRSPSRDDTWPRDKGDYTTQSPLSRETNSIKKFTTDRRKHFNGYNLKKGEIAVDDQCLTDDGYICVCFNKLDCNMRYSGGGSCCLYHGGDECRYGVYCRDSKCERSHPPFTKLIRCNYGNECPKKLSCTFGHTTEERAKWIEKLQPAPRG